MRLFRALLTLVFVALAGMGIAYYLAGRTTPPAISIQQPAGLIGQSSKLEVTVDVPDEELDALTVAIDQSGQTIPVFSLEAFRKAALQSGKVTAALTSSSSSPESSGWRLTWTVGKQTLPQLQPGRATIVITASRRVLRGLRVISSRTTRDVEVRLDPPRASVLSTHHYINQGGSELVVYRVTPADVESGVRVGMDEYPGFPATGAGVSGDENLKVAFFALVYGQGVDTPIELYARDAAGNEAGAQFEHRVFRKQFRRSRIELDDTFLARVVPPIVQHSAELKVVAPSSEDLLPTFLKINGDLRRMNAEKILSFAARTSPTMLWKEPFRQLTNSKVESGFADDRTYTYAGKDVDRQVHLGIDLAVTANVPVLAANRGKVLSAGYLGIYGNCVILDHGMGVQSLYGHLSSIDVREGQEIEQGHTLGRSGQTGLAGGDHLHFTMLVHGRPVSPSEWWDPHWIEDRVRRKLREAGAGK